MDLAAVNEVSYYTKVTKLYLEPRTNELRTLHRPTLIHIDNKTANARIYYLALR